MDTAKSGPGSVNRRRFLSKATAAVVSGTAAASYARVVGANGRIRIGQIGCGKRARGHTKEIHAAGQINQCDVKVTACCDIWAWQREQCPKHVNHWFGEPPRVYDDYRRLLDDRDVDAVTISTPDRQHCGQLIDAVRAGKDVYVEKPIAMNMEELNRAYDAVKASGAIVQNGTQGRSAPGTAAIKKFLAAGGLGRVFRVETVITRWDPYWNRYTGPGTEAETDWKAFLDNRPFRPFDPDQQAAWMGYHEFSSGPVGGWGSHFSDFVHNVTDSRRWPCRTRPFRCRR